jgi:type IV secretion system protein VirB6
MEISITANVLQTLIIELGKYLNGIYPQLMDSFGTVIRTAVTLYIVITGYAVMTGKAKDATREFLQSIFLVVFLQTMILESSAYHHWIVEPFVQSIFSLSGFFLSHSDSFSTGDGVIGMFGSVDQVFGKALYTFNRLVPEGNLVTSAALYFKVGTVLLPFLLIYTVMYAAFAVMIAMGFFSLYVLFIVGGPCIFFGSFSKTRMIFWQWFRSICNYSLLIVFTSIVMSICIYGISGAVDSLAALNASEGVYTVEMGAAIAWALLTIAMLLKCPDFAASISGAQSGSTAGIAGGISLAAGMMMSKGMNTQNMKERLGGAAGSAASTAYTSTVEGVGRAFSKMKGVDRS